MYSHVTSEAIMECIPVSLCFHVPTFNLPFSHVVRHPLSQIVVNQHVSEVVQSQIAYFAVVSFREIDHIWLANVVELFLMGGSTEFKPIPH
jgi:hypothetical protein